MWINLVQSNSWIIKKTGRSFIASSGLVALVSVTLLVHVLGVLLGVVLGLLAVNPVHTLGLGELVDLAADEASDELLGESVADGLAYFQRDIKIRLDKNSSIDNSQNLPLLRSWSS